MAGRVSAADPLYYLALGDSLALGIQPAANGQYVVTNQGYADHLYDYYRALVPGLRLAKFGCSGETTGSMKTGVGSPCTYPSGSQLAEAVAFIQTHHVVLITLDIGADNLLECLNLTAPIDPTCVAAAATTAGNDLAMILGTLKTYGADALIVGMNYYDPFLAAYVFGGSGPAYAGASLLATQGFNSALQTVYQLLEVPFADVAATYRIDRFPVNVLLELTWTWMSAPQPRGPDIHPNAVGYLAIASAFAKTIGAP
jgi:lysophospholipase L1-like esterase